MTGLSLEPRATQAPLLHALAALEDAEGDLERLRENLREEFQRERLLHTEVAERTPALLPRICSLQREQDELSRWVEGLKRLVELGLAPSGSIARDRVRLLLRIRRHLCAEADLLLEAYLRDVGGAG